MFVTVTDSAGWSECSVWLWQRETAQDGVSAQCGDRDSAEWSECSVWLLQRETAQDGVSAWYVCYSDRQCRME